MSVPCGLEVSHKQEEQVRQPRAVNEWVFSGGHGMTSLRNTGGVPLGTGLCEGGLHVAPEGEESLLTFRELWMRDPQ